MVKKKIRSKIKNKSNSNSNLEFSREAAVSTSGILSLLIIFCLFMILIILIYFLYLNIPGEPENLNVNVKNIPELTNNSFLAVQQFYPNMKFNHNEISYKIDSLCSMTKRKNMIKAFSEVSDQIGLISFYETSTNPDIEISCSEIREYGVDKDHFISGEGGAKEIIKTGRYSIINEGIIFLYVNKTVYSIDCNHPNVELHELMHVFGFSHSENKNSLMYPYLESCNQKIDDSIIKELKRLYSEENLPDLYFEKVVVIKKGRYLDFNLTIKNSGSIIAKDISFDILDDNELIERREIGDLDYGGGIFIEVKNFKLIHKNPIKISFIIDKENLIREINKTNNIAEIDL